MMGIEDIRNYAMQLPDVSEGKHFNLPAFMVGQKVFVVIQKDGVHAIFHVDRDAAQAAVAEHPDAYEEVSRNAGRIFVGVRVDLTRVPEESAGRVIEQAWRNKAPKRLVKSYDANL